MHDAVATGLAILLLLVGLPVLILVVRDRTRRRTQSAAHDADRRSHERRILNPDWSRVEEHLQRPAPSALRELYADRDLVTRIDLDWPDEEIISTFEPLDAQALRDAERWLGFEAVTLATTGTGDAVYLRPGSREVDAVYVTHHDGGDTEVFAESVAAMHMTLRKANR
jgi:hypothetical protein